jgi:hypothetical protein
MDARWVRPFISILALVVLSCVVSTPPTEKVRFKLTDEYVELLNEDVLGAPDVPDPARLDAGPLPLYKADFVPPPAMAMIRTYSTMDVGMIITKRGNVKRAWVKASSNKYLNKPMLQSLIQWKFQPAFRNGLPVDTVILVPFQLRREGGGITVDLRKMPLPSRRTVS